MPTIDIDGRTFEVGGDGFLTNAEIWDEEVARLIAKYDGIEKMTEKQLASTILRWARLFLWGSH